MSMRVTGLRTAHNVWLKSPLSRSRRRLYRLREAPRGSGELMRCPHHVMQRRPDGKVLFETAADYQTYLSALRALRESLRLKVYRYCLMPNHVHLILDPKDRPEPMRTLMSQLSSLHGPHLKQPGPHWIRCVLFVPIPSEPYLEHCTRYVDLNPVAAGLVSRPQDYPWSSYRALAGLESDNWLDLDPCFLALGADSRERAQRYRDLLEPGRVQSE